MIGALSRKAGTWSARGKGDRLSAAWRTPASLTDLPDPPAQVPGDRRRSMRLLVGSKAVLRPAFSRQIAGHRNLALYRGTGLQCWLSAPPR
jgi:hypothetical protein